MSKTDDYLARGIREALERKGTCRVAVHSQAQIDSGQRAAQRLAPKYGAYAGDVEFELIPDDMQDLYPVGTILV